MADDILVKVAFDDRGLQKGLKNLSNELKLFGQNINSVISSQKTLTTSQKQVTDSSQKLGKQQRINKQLLGSESQERKQNNALLQADIKHRFAERRALADVAEQQRIQAQNLRDAAKFRQLEIDKITRAKDAKSALIRQTKEEDAAAKKRIKTLREDIIQRSKATARLKAYARAQKKASVSGRTLHLGMIDITNQGRLLNNSFATLRSRLLLMSFGFGLVSAAVTRNIQAFAEQEDSVARLALQFGTKGADALDEYSSALQKATRFGDESINAVMAQFGAYGASIDQTKKLAKVTLDLAEGTSMDLNTAALAVAKSFGTSTNALQRYGIELNNNMNVSQKINSIIATTQVRYGGMAKLMGSLAGSSIRNLNMAFGDLTERFGEVLTSMNPTIRGLTRFIDSIDTKRITTLIQAVTSLGTSFAILKGMAALGGVITAASTARSMFTKLAAVQAVTTGATVGLSGAFRIFNKVIIGTKGALGGFAIAGTVVLTVAQKLWGWFNKTSEETEEARTELDKYHVRIKKFRTDNAETELSAFYLKLLEGNDLLKLYNKSMTVNLIDAMQGIKELLPTELNNTIADQRTKLKELNADLKDLEKRGDLFTYAVSLNFPEEGVLVSDLENLNNQINNVVNEQDMSIFIQPSLEIPAGEADAIFADLAKLRNDIAGSEGKFVLDPELSTENLVAITPEDIIVNADTIRSDINNVTADIAKLEASILSNANSVQNYGPEFKSAFQEITGVSDTFFNKYIAGSKIKDEIDLGNISTNEQLLNVMQKSIDNNGKLTETEIEQALAETELIEIKKRLTEEQDAYNSAMQDGLGIFNQSIEQQILANLAQQETIITNSLGRDLTIEEAAALKGLISVHEDLTVAKETDGRATKKLMKWKDMSLNQAILHSAKLAGLASAALGSNKKNAKLAMQLDQYAAVANAWVAASDALKEGSGPMRFVDAAFALATGLGYAAQVQSQIDAMSSVSASGGGGGGGQIMGYAYGGYVGGNRHNEGGTMIEAERGEFVMSRAAVQSIGLENLNQMNLSGGSTEGVTVNISGNVMTQEFVEGELLDAIEEAVRRGNNFGA